MTSLVWFRQDLRIADNAALTEAAQAGPVVCLYVLDEDTPKHWRIGGAQRWWLQHSLAALAREIEQLGSRLILRRGPSAIVVAEVADEVGAAAIHATRQFEPWWRAADAALGDRLTLHDGDTLVAPEQVTTGAGRPFKIYGPFWRALSQHLPPPDPLPAPKRLQPPASFPPSDKLDDWDLLPTKPDWATGFTDWHPGEQGAATLLKAFREHAAEYARRRDLPSEAGTSSLSPHLHFGEISARTVWHRLADAEGGKFLKELAWRDFSRHVILADPQIGERPQRDAGIRWRTGAAAEADFKRWTRGRTGYPIVDAGMRQLWATGWMHNRVRLITASFLVKHLLIDWRRGAEWFWDTLVDADYANNSQNWQWIAGTGFDSQPFYRVMAPLTQSAKFDAADYIRRWVSELTGKDDRAIHEPVDPIVGHKEGRERALAALAKARPR